jgi:phosphoadenosine phosphosulfate reductase
MSEQALKLCIPRPGQHWTQQQLDAVNPCLEKMSAQDRVQWALDFLPDQVVLTSSFGIQAALMLHLVTQVKPRIPVVLIDTGYLFDETYRFIDELTERLDLNLHIYRPQISPAWQEQRYGRLWEQGAEGIRRYNFLNKVEPMQRVLKDLNVGTWLSGLRRTQSDTRSELSVLQRQGNVVKVYPLVDWNNRDVHQYLKHFDLPYHPLWEQGYVSIGDHHSSRPLQLGESEQDTRFSGLLRECGLHEVEHFTPSLAQDQNGLQVKSAVATA